MATDVMRILENLLAFFDFSGKSMISVGAGGGQLAGYGATAASVTAVDPDGEALERLRRRVGELGLVGRFTLVEADFLAVTVRAEVVLFEFSLHEIPDPAAALRHARTLAPDIVVLDHAEGSAWAHTVVETEKAASSWAAVRAEGVRELRRFQAVQRFAGYEELRDKVAVQGEEALRRIEQFRGAAGIEIAMPYALALLEKAPSANG